SPKEEGAVSDSDRRAQRGAASKSSCAVPAWVGDESCRGGDAVRVLAAPPARRGATQYRSWAKG
ncbi:hypothetical protein C3L29_035600, partial [Pseudomonas sp. MWU12-2534b]